MTETTTGTRTVTTDWPTAELHVHVEGTMEVELLVELARRNDVDLPTSDPDVLRESYAFTDLQAFLDRLYANLRVLRTAQDFHDLAISYLRRAHRASLRRSTRHGASSACRSRSEKAAWIAEVDAVVAGAGGT